MLFAILFFIGFALLCYALIKNAKIQKMPETEGIKTLRNKNANLIIVSTIFLVVGAIGLFIQDISKPDPNAWKTRNNSSMAYAMMQGFVKDRLRSPSSAKFEWITEPGCIIVKEGFDYSISSWVDSQNAFGVMIRTRFSGVVRQIDDETWQLMELEFEE